MPSLLSSLRSTPLAVVDVETTGASPRFGDRVTEIGVVRYEGGVPVREVARLVDPKRRINPGVIALTGITQEMVDGQPTFAERLPELVEVMRGAVVVGHNVRFDLGFLGAEFRRAGTTLTNELENPHVLDTVRIARRRFGRGGNGLQVLSRRLGVLPTMAHRALADAVTTGQVLERLLEPAGGFGATLVDALQAQGGPMPLEPASAETSHERNDLPLELIEAIECRGRVRLRYLDARRKESIREIDPIEIRRFRGTATLIAHCHLRNDRRTFKLERIVAVERVGSVSTDL